MTRTHFVITLIGIFLYFPLRGQEVKKAIFKAQNWEVRAEKFEFVEYKGKESLLLENGIARLKEASLKNGIIDFDVNFAAGRKFVGVHFRGQGGGNYEEFYLRAHQSGNPDAMQYTPVINGLSGWQLYHGKGYSNAYNYNFDEWIHVRLIVADQQMNVFINDMSQAMLHAHDLKREAQSGQLGFSANLGAAYFANLTYQEIDNPTLLSKAEKLPEAEAGTISNWQVSGLLKSESLEALNDLSELKIPESGQWQSLNTEYSGLLNLAHASGIGENGNTLLAKVIIDSDKKQLKRMDFGYSDIAKVYVNGDIQYAGQRLFRSRDYRYLGTIGYFDSVYLQLNKGKNEIVFAVTENFGGWGLKAKIEDRSGISIE